MKKVYEWQENFPKEILDWLLNDDDAVSGILNIAGVDITKRHLALLCTFRGIFKWTGNCIALDFNWRKWNTKKIIKWFYQLKNRTANLAWSFRVVMVDGVGCWLMLMVDGWWLLVWRIDTNIDRECIETILVFIIHYSLIATIPTTNNHQPTKQPTAGRKCEDDLCSRLAPLLARKNSILPGKTSQNAQWKLPPAGSLE